MKRRPITRRTIRALAAMALGAALIAGIATSANWRLALIAALAAGAIALTRLRYAGVAALVVLAASVLAGLDRVALAGGLAAATTLLLAEKSRLHAFVARIDGEGFRAGVRFAVLALVVLPLVPEGPFGTWGGGIRPRSLWLLVLVKFVTPPLISWPRSPNGMRSTWCCPARSG